MGQFLHSHYMQQAHNKQILEKDTIESSIDKFNKPPSREEEGSGSD